MIGGTADEKRLPKTFLFFKIMYINGRTTVINITHEPSRNDVQLGSSK
jgi:hypothetical protein